MHIIKGRSVVPGTHSETKYLKSIFGDNWKEGARNNRHIDHVSSGDIEKARAAKAARADQQRSDVIKSSVLELKSQGKISGDQAHRMINSL